LGYTLVRVLELIKGFSLFYKAFLEVIDFVLERNRVDIVAFLEPELNEILCI
jgi:hypothetical protein